MDEFGLEYDPEDFTVVVRGREVVAEISNGLSGHHSDSVTTCRDVITGIGETPDFLQPVSSLTWKRLKSLQIQRL